MGGTWLFQLGTTCDQPNGKLVDTRQTTLLNTIHASTLSNFLLTPKPSWTGTTYQPTLPTSPNLIISKKQYWTTCEEKTRLNWTNNLLHAHTTPCFCSIWSVKQYFKEEEEITKSENGILHLLEKLNPNKAGGPDDIKPAVLKGLAKEIAPILAIIFKKSLSSGTIPSNWRKARLTQAFKKGQKDLPANYRPISLTCVCCKIMEHIVTSHIMHHAEENNILYPLQHGFRSKRSCETQLLECIHDLTRNLQNGTQTDLLILEFSKAFDKVFHTLLTHKLGHYGISGKTLTWIKAFLTDRSQVVQ